jgi:hypothetical protein
MSDAFILQQATSCHVKWATAPAEGHLTNVRRIYSAAGDLLPPSNGSLPQQKVIWPMSDAFILQNMFT